MFFYTGNAYTISKSSDKGEDMYENRIFRNKAL